MKENSQKILICNCNESVYEGLPCRHELCILIKESKTLSNLKINQRWTKEYFSQDNLSDVSDSEEEEEEEEEKEEEKESCVDFSEEYYEGDEEGSEEEELGNERKEENSLSQVCLQFIIRLT